MNADELADAPTGCVVRTRFETTELQAEGWSYGVVILGEHLSIAFGADRDDMVAQSNCEAIHCSRFASITRLKLIDGRWEEE